MLLTFGINFALLVLQGKKRTSSGCTTQCSMFFIVPVPYALLFLLF